MSDTLLDVQNLTMKFGGLVAIDELTFLQKNITSHLSLVQMEQVKQQFSIV